MSELQHYYDCFNAGSFARVDPDHCRCHGGGWALSEVDTWHKCPIHYDGQRHPEDECDDAMNSGETIEVTDAATIEAMEAVTPATVNDDDIPF